MDWTAYRPRNPTLAWWQRRGVPFALVVSGVGIFWRGAPVWVDWAVLVLLVFSLFVIAVAIWRGLSAREPAQGRRGDI